MVGKCFRGLASGVVFRTLHFSSKLTNGHNKLERYMILGGEINNLAYLTLVKVNTKTKCCKYAPRCQSYIASFCVADEGEK
jgi:hypothetical protein